MTPDIGDLLRKAKSSIQAAEMLMANGFPGYAVARAYYAMFYTAQAYLEDKELAFSKHSAVIAEFGQRFAHTGHVLVQFHRYLIDAMADRHKADYGPQEAINEAKAALHISRAREFLALAEQQLGLPPPA